MAAKEAPPRDERGLEIPAMVESIVGCKWSLHVLAEVARGNNRPGKLVRSAPGLTSKVLAERLDKMVRFGIFKRVSYPEVPPRVEYFLTPLGERFRGIIAEVEKLQRDVESGRVEDRPG
ncbi:MAG: helix-turn-helix transcriptional regulator [Phycisphaerales bacterium]|nr:helix-turn-helix transcriptional regulator [Phycisphaerales bacterium]